MNETFSVGEIAIFVRPGSEHYGEEVTVTSGMKEGAGGYDKLLGRITTAEEDGYGYEIDFGIVPEGHYAWFAKKEWLRKKQQKRDIDQLVSWDKCLWQPKKVTA
jgi:hypothetical protein